MVKKNVAVVGAGVGGLAIACRLAFKGFDVSVYEKLPLCGGRNNIIEDRGFKFDTGPSFVLMPGYFEELFAYCQQDLSSYLDLRVLDVNYKIFYPDGDVLTVYRDSEKTKEEFERFEKNAGKRFDNFLEEIEKIYTLVQPLLYRCFTKKDLLDLNYAPLVFKLKPWLSYWDMSKKFFRSQKLCYALTFEAMFMGVSPYQAPGFYSIITYTDHKEKIRHPMGGMYQIPLALERMGKKFGVRFYYGCEVERIEPGRPHLVKTKEMTQEADCVVMNADYAYAQQCLLGRRLPEYNYSCSVYLLYLGLKKKISVLEHHNLFFSSNLNRNLSQIFKDGSVVPDDPSFYIHVPTVTDPSLAPEGKEILYILIPVANLKLNTFRADVLDEKIRPQVFAKINALLGINIEDYIEVEHRFYPQDFVSRYNILYGSTFGLAHNLMQSAFFRPPNFDRKFENLYYVGASTQPGGGLPVVLASSRIVADMIV